ncbi:putative tail-associated lysozyme [Pseudomonas phage Psa21]|uniref:Putative tail-associated lysozyme n=1 Tax=Pseudomonas phage Psa21 TaxID=2530023 RepID=A0A481W4Y7_9CAUD|nr:putative tail-associated lysozyme [Pseudomonas phage Psa21]QBJ02748.1 putative tail-associated lysozyme [Pseudomonas phage Psa21]
MPGISRAGIDSAGGVIQPTQRIATINGAPIATVGASVTGHGSGAHAGPVMVQGSVLFTINGIAVVLAGMRASCNDTASGDPKHTCSA